MKRSTFIALLTMLLIGCGAAPLDTNNLVFLTRGGCANTTTMRANLDASLKSMNLSTNYQFIDLDKLDKSDPRTGYPTPTLLFKGTDLFGMEVPTPPFPEPT